VAPAQSREPGVSWGAHDGLFGIAGSECKLHREAHPKRDSASMLPYPRDCLNASNVSTVTE
jgi:hypothetical protein